MDHISGYEVIQKFLIEPWSGWLVLQELGQEEFLAFEWV